LTERLVLSSRVYVLLTSFLNHFTEFEGNGWWRSDFVFSVEFGDLGVIGSRESFVAGS